MNDTSSELIIDDENLNETIIENQSQELEELPLFNLLHSEDESQTGRVQYEIGILQNTTETLLIIMNTLLLPTVFLSTFNDAFINNLVDFSNFAITYISTFTFSSC